MKLNHGLFLTTYKISDKAQWSPIKRFIFCFSSARYSNTSTNFFHHNENRSLWAFYRPPFIAFSVIFIRLRVLIIKLPTLNMKALITILLILLIGAIALAQNTKSYENKTESFEVGLRLDHCPVRNIDCEELAINANNDIVRLYKRSNTRIYRALNFRIKYTKAKLA